MNWKKGTNRLVWVISSLSASFILLFGNSRMKVTGLLNAYTNKQAEESFFWAIAAFGFVWLLYGLSLHIYKGFQDEKPISEKTFTNEIPIRKGPSPKTPFWQWITGKFPPENDPYRKKATKKNK